MKMKFFELNELHGADLGLPKTVSELGEVSMKAASEIIGIGSYVPSRKITNQDVLAMLEEQSRPYLDQDTWHKLHKKAEKTLIKTGNKYRYWCEADEYGPDMAYQASLKAIKDAGISREEIDLVIYTGMSKALVEPATGHVLKNLLGLRTANVIDTQDACASFHKSLEIADSLIKAGKYKTILIAAGERAFDWADFRCKSYDEFDWKLGSLTIGDGAGALIVRGTTKSPYTDHLYHMYAQNEVLLDSYIYCHIGLNFRDGERYKLFSNSKLLIQGIYEASLELFKKFNALRGEVFSYKNKVVLFHDVGNVIQELFLVQLAREGLVQADDSYISYFHEYGNVGSVSLPLNLDLARKDGRLKKGDEVFFFCGAAGVQAGLISFIY